MFKMTKPDRHFSSIFTAASILRATLIQSRKTCDQRGPAGQNLQSIILRDLKNMRTVINIDQIRSSTGNICWRGVTTYCDKRETFGSKGALPHCWKKNIPDFQPPLDAKYR
jgi:hypothetical protein